MGNKYRAKPKGNMTSPKAKSTYRGTKLISSPNGAESPYNSSGSMTSEYASRMKAIEIAGPARKIALKKILHKGI